MENSVDTSFIFSNGEKIPALGLTANLGNSNTPSVEKGVLQGVVKTAITMGCRHIDSAWIYNETEIGEAIQEKILDGTVTRKDLFVTTKLWSTFHAKADVKEQLKKSLAKLQLDYVDLFLIHFPMAFTKSAGSFAGKDDYSDIDYLETWVEMEECFHQKLTRSIGVANFNSKQLKRLLQNCTVHPVANYIEVNPFMNQKKMIQFCKERNIDVIGYCPYGYKQYVQKRTGPSDPTFCDAGLSALCRRTKRWPHQMVLNYMIFHLGIPVTFKAKFESTIKENIDCLKFVLSKQEVEYLDQLNVNRRNETFDVYESHPLYPFKDVEF